MSIKKILLSLLLIAVSASVFAKPEEESGEEFNASEMILHHVLDSHDWHITDLPSGGLHLPWIIYSSRDGVVFYANSHAMMEDGKYAELHGEMATKYGRLVALNGNGGHHEGGHEEEHDHSEHGEHDEHGGHGEHHVAESSIDASVTVIDFSITKTVLQLILMGLLVLLVFSSVARAYTKRKGQAPKGMQSLFEPIIMFVRDEIGKNYLGNKAAAFTPYLLTLFFLIWFSNLFGLTPLNSNIMGNISVTAALSVLTFFLIQFNGSKDYWMHILWPPAPLGVKLILIPVEILGMFTKPFALAIRLFANISAGHFMVLALISLIFIMGEAGKNAVGAFSIAPLSIAFTLVIFALEMIVAIVQAYIFTLLTAVFIGMAAESHDDHH